VVWLTNVITFGAADMSTIKRWAELLMVAGSLIALAAIGSRLIRAG
jgi:hypothetical protein